MPQEIELEITSVDIKVDEETQDDVQVVTLELRYNGSVDLSGQIVQGELLSIEIPSHAPPPQP